MFGDKNRSQPVRDKHGTLRLHRVLLILQQCMKGYQRAYPCFEFTKILIAI